jgi:hypothetical protein
MSAVEDPPSPGPAPGAAAECASGAGIGGVRSRIAVAFSVVLLLALFAVLLQRYWSPTELKTSLIGNSSSTLRLDGGADHTASAYGEFRWSGPVPPRGHYYRVQVFDEAKQSEWVAESPNLVVTHWQPDAARTTHWPDRVRWELTLRNEQGDVQDFNWAYRSRR